MRKKKIVIVGAGYVGIAVSIILSGNNDIILYDIDNIKVDLMKSGISPINDGDMREFFKSIKNDTCYTITSDSKGIFERADYVVIAVPTNWNQDNHSLDITTLCGVLEQVKKENKSPIIIIKSTLPLGTMDYLRHKYNSLSIFYVPEFLREGSAVKDEKNPNRLVIGTNDFKARHIEEIKSLFLNGQTNDDVPVLITSGKEAELIKLYSNAFLALRVAFFNEIDTYAEIENLDSKRIIEGVSLDPRIGNFYNVPSFGYGGYCLPKDTRELQYVYNNVPSAVIPSLVQSNVIRKRYIAETIIKLIERTNASEPLIGIYRLNMKRDSDNFREAAILDIIAMLIDAGYKVVVFEPLQKRLESCSFTFMDDLEEFKWICSIIVANRMSCDLHDISEKVYTRDWF